jgi:hypothetical protein
MADRPAGDPGRDSVDAEHRHQAESSLGMGGLAASLVERMADGTGLSMPFDPGREPGTYRPTIPQGRALRDLRVRIVTTDARFEVPVER